MLLESLNVSLGQRTYPIHIGRGLAPTLANQVEGDLSSGYKAAVITDENVVRSQETFLNTAFAALPSLVLPAGESTKAFPQMERCCEFLAASGLDRGGRLYAVGGGVIGDLAGFVAASYYRGIGFYQVPTTLLAMVDSSVGGKTGINLTQGKNLVGAFHQPLAVYADLDTLQTLPEREFSAGMAEVIKHGLLADADLFAELERKPELDPSSVALSPIIRRNCALKAGVVSADEREQSASGGRALLNLGHTFGHAIEAVAGYGTYLHGEAVAVGLVLAARLSVELGMVEAAVPERISALLEQYKLPVRLREPLPVDELLGAARKDKKSRSGRLRYVALKAVGTAVMIDAPEEELIRGLWCAAGAAD